MIASLFLWATIPMLPQALAVMKAWGFDYKSHRVWGKDRDRAPATGFANRTSYSLIGTRGNVPAPAPGTQWDSVIMSRRLASIRKSRMRSSK